MVVHRLQHSRMCHISPMLSHYSHNYSYCTWYGTLHYWDGEEFHTFLPKQQQQPSGVHNTVFSHISRITNQVISLESLQPVEIHNQTSELAIIGRIPKNSRDFPQQALTPWQGIDKETRQLCGNISMPMDQGRNLIEYVQSNNTSLIGVSDALVVNGNGRHTWIITTVDKHHIDDSSMMMCGKGVVGGHQHNMPSAQAELHGQTALDIMTSYLFKLHQIPRLPVTSFCNNQGILCGCRNSAQTKLHYHGRANMDLYLE